MLTGALPFGEGVWSGGLLLFLPIGDRYSMRGAELGALQIQVHFAMSKHALKFGCLKIQNIVCSTYVAHAFC